MAAGRLEDLRVIDNIPPRVDALKKELLRLFGRSLKLREVSAGSCNGCDLEIQALGNIVFDWSRFGIQIVASPRRADGLIVTGPVSRNMELALQKTYEAVPDPRLVIAVGACALSGGIFCRQPRCFRWGHSGDTRRSLHPWLSSSSAYHPGRRAAALKSAEITSYALQNRNN